MRRLLPLLIGVIVTPLSAAAHHETLVAHAAPHEVVYLVLSGYSKQRSDIVDVETIPMKSMDECETVGKRIIESRKLHVLRKGYECIPGLL